MGHRRACRILRQTRLVDALLASPRIAAMDFAVLRALRATPPVAAVDSFQWPAATTAARREVPAGRVAAPIPVRLLAPSPVATRSSVAPPAVCAVKVAAPRPPGLLPSHPATTTSRSAFQARSAFPARRSVRSPSASWPHSSRQCRAPFVNSSPLVAHKAVPSVRGRQLPQEEGWTCASVRRVPTHPARARVRPCSSKCGRKRSEPGSPPA